MLTVAHIDKDYISKSDEPAYCVGVEWTQDEVISKCWGDVTSLQQLTTETPRIRFRLRDEDNVIHYGGWLLNDDGCLVQECLYNWGCRMSGACIIEVKPEGKDEWEMEIG